MRISKVLFCMLLIALLPAAFCACSSSQTSSVASSDNATLESSQQVGLDKAPLECSTQNCGAVAVQVPVRWDRDDEEQEAVFTAENHNAWLNVYMGKHDGKAGQEDLVLEKKFDDMKSRHDVTTTKMTIDGHVAGECSYTVTKDDITSDVRVRFIILDHCYVSMLVAVLEDKDTTDLYLDYADYALNNIEILDPTYIVPESDSSSAASAASSKSSSASTQVVESFDPGKTYKQGDVAKFSGYSLGGEATVDQKTGKKSAIVFFSTDANASPDNAQAIIMLDTVRATDAGAAIQCTAVCAAVGDDGIPIFTEM